MASGSEELDGCWNILGSSLIMPHTVPMAKDCLRCVKAEECDILASELKRRQLLPLSIHCIMFLKQTGHSSLAGVLKCIIFMISALARNNLSLLSGEDRLENVTLVQDI